MKKYSVMIVSAILLLGLTGGCAQERKPRPRYSIKDAIANIPRHSKPIEAPPAPGKAAGALTAEDSDGVDDDEVDDEDVDTEEQPLTLGDPLVHAPAGVDPRTGKGYPTYLGAHRSIPLPIYAPTPDPVSPVPRRALSQNM